MPDSSSSSQNSPEVDKDILYGMFEGPLKWRNRLEEKLAHKSLDIPLDSEEMNVDNSKHGWGWKEVIAIGAIGVGLAFAFRPPTEATEIPAVSEDRDTTRSTTIEPYHPET